MRNKLQTIQTEQDNQPQTSTETSNSSSFPGVSLEIWRDFDLTVINVIGRYNTGAAGIIEMDKYLNEPK